MTVLNERPPGGEPEAFHNDTGGASGKDYQVETSTKGMTWDDARGLAEKLAASGIPTFPVALKYDHKAGKVLKRPLTPHGHLDATTDPDALADLFRRHTRLGPGEWPGVGAYPGPAGFLVVDVDRLTALDDLEEDHGDLPGRRVRTPSGGLHVWSRLPEGVEVGQSSPWPGIDIRSSKGWVVAPGVRSPWGNWETEGGTLDTAPRWVLDTLRTVDNSPAEIPARAEPGDRHAALVSLAASMWAKGLDRAAVLHAIRGYNAEQCRPPKPDDELVDIVDWVVTKDGGPPTLEVVRSQPPTGGTFADLLNLDIEPIRFVVDGLIPEGLTILAGKPKLGKSWLALLLALAVCAGRDALGRRTVAGEGLYIALEDGDRRLQDRVRVLGGVQMGAALQRLHYRTDWPALSRGGVAALEQWMSHHPDTRLIVIDTYARVRGDLPGKDRYAEEYNLLAPLQKFATDHRVAVVLVHHLRKQGADDWLEQLSGSQAVTGTADTLLGLFRERGQMDATLRLVSREVDELDLALKFNAGSWESMGDAAAYRITVERSAILKALEDLGGEGKVADIAALVEKTAANTSKLIIGLAKEGLVVKRGHGLYSLPGPVEVVETVEIKSTTPPPKSTASPGISTKSTTTVDQSPLQVAAETLTAAGVDFEEVAE